MAGAAPTGFQFTKTLEAGPVHCSVWLCLSPAAFELIHRRVEKVPQTITGAKHQFRLPANEIANQVQANVRSIGFRPMLNQREESRHEIVGAAVLARLIVMKYRARFENEELARLAA